MPEKSEALEEPPTDVDRLFREYIRAREAGENPRPTELCERSSDPEALRRRIRVYDELDGLGASLATEVGAAGIEGVSRERPAEGSLGRFTIASLLGEGGIARVYRAHDPDLGRDVALKVIDRGPLVSERARQWMLKEARSLARLDHPGVVRVFEVGSTPEHDYIVMELLEGPTLAQVVGDLRRLDRGTESHRRRAPKARAVTEIALRIEPFRERARLLLDLARALAGCHDRGVLHRDVKPANVQFDQEGRAKLIDFGLAHLAEDDLDVDITGHLVGTPAYIAPEQVESGRTGSDPASDQFSFGIVMYELLSVTSPFLRATRGLTLQAVSRAELKPLQKVDASIPRDLITISAHCLERRPKDRYPSMEGVAEDLRAFLEHRPLTVAMPSPARVLALWLRRHRRRVVAGAAVVALLVLALLGQTYREVAGRRSEVREILAEQRERSPTTPAEFLAAAEELERARRLAAEVDGALLAGWVPSSATKEVENGLREWDERLAAAIDASQRTAAELSLGFDFGPWQLVLEADGRMCEDRACSNLEDRLRGTLRIENPGELHVYKHTPRLDARSQFTGWHTLAEYPATVGATLRLSDGTYRVRLDPPSGLPRECDVLIARWAPALVLDLHPPDPSFLPRMVSIPGGVEEFVKPSSTATVGPFRISREPVTWADVLPFAERFPEQVDPENVRGLPPTEFARLSHRQAIEFARFHGMRLPTDLELCRALRVELIQLARSDPGIQGELVSTPAQGSAFQHQALSFRFLDLTTHFPPLANTTPIPTDSASGFQDAIDSETRSGYAFRLALSGE